MNPNQPAEDPVTAAVRTVTDRLLNSVRGRVHHGVDRHLPGLLSRNTPPDDAGLWLALDLTALHPLPGPGLDVHVFGRAATAVTAAAQLWARSEVRHQRTAADRNTALGAVLARAAASRASAEDDLARTLRAHTLDEVLPRLRPLVNHVKAAGLPLDYGLLAADLYTWQQPHGPRLVGQRWAHAFTQAKARTRRTTLSPGKADTA